MVGTEAQAAESSDAHTVGSFSRVADERDGCCATTISGP